MSRCIYCGKILPDEWIIREGASLMGRRGDKSRSTENAQKAARARWAKEKRKPEAVSDFKIKAWKPGKEKKKKRRRKKK
jgi:hypothetical protein